MPAHIKCALFGVSLSIPIANGRLALGTWQGIWLENTVTKVALDVCWNIMGSSN